MKYIIGYFWHLALITGIALLSFLFTCGINVPSRGEKIGQIVRVNQEGVINKTYEAQLIRGGLTDGSGIMGQSFEFTVPKGHGFERKLSEAMNNRQEVRVKYRTEGIYLTLRSGSRGTFLEGVEVIK